MTNSTISLEEITNRVFEIRQKKKDEIDIPYQKEIEEFKKTHKQGFFFWSKHRKPYEEGLKVIQTKYQDHPLIQEWAKLQEQCPHNYDQWQEIDGPSEMRTCSVCYNKQHRWNFSDLDGGCGLG